MSVNSQKGDYLTVEEYLYGQVNLPIPSEGIKNIAFRRGVSLDAACNAIAVESLDLCTADLYVWLCTSPSRVGAVSDSDNGWSHSDGGYTLSDADKNRFMRMANSLYEKYGEEPIQRSRIRITHHGIKPCNYNLDGTPL